MLRQIANKDNPGLKFYKYHQHPMPPCPALSIASPPTSHFKINLALANTPKPPLTSLKYKNGVDYQNLDL